jgi:hypothetical protein
MILTTGVASDGGKRNHDERLFKKVLVRLFQIPYRLEYIKIDYNKF